MSDTVRPQVLLVSSDLLLYSQLAGSAERAGVELVTPAAHPAAPVAVALDLAGADSVAETVTNYRQRFGPSVVVWAFGPHVQVAKLAEARAAGCELVTSRGDFVQRAAERFATLGQRTVS